MFCIDALREHSILSKESCFLTPPLRSLSEENEMIQKNDFILMFVDDDRDLTTSCEILFGKIYTTKTASNAYEAVKIVEALTCPAGIFMDFQLGSREVNGIGLYKHLRTLTKQPLACVFVSGDEQAQLLAIQDTDTIGFCLKPAPFDMLEAYIGRMQQHILLQQAAGTDALTKLYNRYTFEIMAEQTLALARREGTTTAFILIDLDGFKEINDTHGHIAGDEVLIAVAERLNEQTNTRKTDVVIRYGGDEFVIILPHATMAQAKIILERLRASVENTPVILKNGMQIPVHLSAGVAAVDHHRIGDKIAEQPKAWVARLLKLCDDHMYREKKNRTGRKPR